MSLSPPDHQTAGDVAQQAAVALLTARPLVVLTGAGLSTDSGIPDYRGPRPAGTPVPQPMTYQDFVSGPDAQQRYWARAHIGWSRMSGKEPNAGHLALAAIDPELLITQNVDGLHEAAGTRNLVALHGRIAEIICLGCRVITPRAALQERMYADNPDWIDRHRATVSRPDGDVDLDDPAVIATYRTPTCPDCTGALKPHVVFFGENVPKERVARSYAAVERLADTRGALLAAGSSLTVMSGLRFVKRAASYGVPVVIVNRGITRGDDLATYKVESGCSEFLGALRSARSLTSA